MARPQPPQLRYRLLSVPLFLFWVTHAIWQAIKNRLPSYLIQRIGWLPHSQFSTRPIWLHAASIGEIELIKPLVERLHHDYPLVVTTFSATGLKHARLILPSQVQVFALPIDLLPVSRHFIRRFNFSLALIAETELWPETLYQAAQRQIPLIQLNARLSKKSLDTSPWAKKLLQQTLSYFSCYLTRTETDRQNLHSMGVDPGRIQVLGNLKLAGLSTQREYPRLINTPYILFASTHPTEERLFAELYAASGLDQLMVIAPRHPHRAADIIRELKSLNLKLQQRSRNTSLQQGTQLYLADTLGELKAFMAHATLVVMGGSFTAIGGHNVLEPASLGRAIITGPDDSNIRQDIALLKAQQGIIQVNDNNGLRKEIERLMADRTQRQRLGQNALAVVHQQQQVLDDYLRVIKGYL